MPGTHGAENGSSNLPGIKYNGTIMIELPSNFQIGQLIFCEDSVDVGRITRIGPEIGLDGCLLLYVVSIYKHMYRGPSLGISRSYLQSRCEIFNETNACKRLDRVMQEYKKLGVF